LKICKGHSRPIKVDDVEKLLKKEYLKSRATEKCKYQRRNKRRYKN